MRRRTAGLLGTGGFALAILLLVGMAVLVRGYLARLESVGSLFDPFRCARGARAGGLGLGLFITQQIVQAHGGAIEVRSTADDGTTFVARLPRARR